MTTYTIAPKIEFLLSGSEIHKDVFTDGVWNGRTREGVTLRDADAPIDSGYDALVLAMRRGQRSKRGLRVELNDEARRELIEFLEAQIIGARDSEAYDDVAAIRRAFKRLGVQA